jgi:hypothetical protein
MRWAARRWTEGRALAPLCLGLLLLPLAAHACDFCRPRVRAGIFDAHFAGRLALTLLPLVATLLLVALIVWSPWERRAPGAADGEDAWR